ncbi:YggS family pyridoxal phosphate-dependent enzyme [bacterium]|nr:YggS family pyridoxal phosphate-dependent enzyme [bacterium]
MINHGEQPLPERYKHIRQRIDDAAAQAGRDSASITLVAITKTNPLDMARKAYALGLRHFGENRIQEALEKWQHQRPLGSEKPEILHLVGHLQRNKVRKALQLFERIDAVDSAHLAEAISRISGELERTTDILIEVNTSSELQKFGVEPEAALDLAARCAEHPNLRLRGLMTIGPLTSDTTRIADAFRTLKKLFDDLNSGGLDVDILSMGMSDDFEIAIAEGATEIRLGTALFGARSKL